MLWYPKSEGEAVAKGHTTAGVELRGSLCFSADAGPAEGAEEPLRRARGSRRKEAVLVIINGAPVPAAGQVLKDCLAENGYDPARVAVERNGEIVPRATFDGVVLREGDVLEVVQFVGGG